MTRPVHFEILAEDPDKTVKFYEEVFGWEIGKWGEGDQGYWPVTTGSGDGINGGILNPSLPTGRHQHHLGAITRGNNR